MTLKTSYLTVSLFMMGTLMGCGKLEKTSQLSTPEAPNHTPPGTLWLSSFFKKEPSGGMEVFCGGTYIDKGVVITASSCLKQSLWQNHEGLVLRFPTSETLALTTKKLNIVHHPYDNLSLVFFDPALVSSDPTTTKISLKKKPAVYRFHPGAYFVSVWAPHPSSGEPLLRKKSDLSVHAYQKNLHHTHPTPGPCEGILPFKGWKALSKPFACFGKYRLNLLIMANSQDTDTFFCPEDLGGGLRDSEDSLIGILTYPVSTQNILDTTVSADGLRPKGCQKAAFAVDLRRHHPWIKTTLYLQR